MRGRSFLAVGTVLVLGWAGTATAANGGPPSSPPGQAVTPPGQEQTPPGQAKKADADSGSPSPPGQQQTPPGQQQTAPGQAAESVVESAPPAAPPSPRAPARPEHVRVPHVKISHTDRGPRSAPQSSVAHTHVILCHRTGSSSNPYVVINVSMEAWLHGHAIHPALDGRNDIVLKQGAAPGEKLPKSLCTHSAPRTTVVETASGPQARLAPTPAKPRQPGDPSASRGPAVRHAADHRVSRPSAVAAQVAASASAGELPFTGLPIWIAALAGLWMVGTGLALRKAFYGPGAAEAPALAHVRTASHTGAGSSRS